MPHITLKERTTHLASYTIFTRDTDQYKDVTFTALSTTKNTFFKEHVSLATFAL